ALMGRRREPGIAAPTAAPLRDEQRVPGAQQFAEQGAGVSRSEEHTSELQSLAYLVCRLLLEKKNQKYCAHCPRKLPVSCVLILFVFSRLRDHSIFPASRLTLTLWYVSADHLARQCRPALAGT